jgi:hypothetical protein
MRQPFIIATAFAAAGLAASLAATAHADPDHIEVSLGASARALRSPSANALTDRDLGGVALGVAREIGRDLGIDAGPGALAGPSLWAEAGAITSTATGTMFQSLSTSIESIAITGGLGARYRLHRLVGLDLHAGLGAQRARVAISDATATAYDHAWGLLAAASAGIDIFAVRRPFSLGARLEAGYALAQGIAMTPHTDQPGDARPLAMTAAGLGRLDLSGPSASLSAFAQF